MNKTKIRRVGAILLIPTIYGLYMRLIFGTDSWEAVFKVMSLTFLFCIPVIMGALTVYFSKTEDVKKLAYRVFIPWIPIFGFFAISMLFLLEGIACLAMILPVFMAAASAGGLIGGYFKLRKKDNRVYISFLLVVPLLLSPVESLIGAVPGTYEAYTYIDINAPAERIWSNVTRVSEIGVDQDKGWLTNLLGFPRPVKAELNYEGVGAYREAIFTNGLVFHETVSEYIDQKKMVFSIKAFPHEIPAATLDEHVVIGGEYFDVLNGTYELEKLNEKTFRLHLYSHFKLATTFNFYASWWGKWIMKDIQNNILQVEKMRAESALNR